MAHLAPTGLIDRSRMIMKPKEKAEHINAFFVEKIDKLNTNNKKHIDPGERERQRVSEQHI